MPSADNPARKPKAKGSPHHERYPQRLHAHLSAAVEAAEALSAPLPVEGQQPTPEALLAAYGPSETAGEG
jgi:hypothetical protein